MNETIYASKNNALRTEPIVQVDRKDGKCKNLMTIRLLKGFLMNNEKNTRVMA